MANIRPNQLFPAIQNIGATATSVSNGIFIPLAALPGLTAAEADPTTGDGRELSRVLIEQITTAIGNLTAAEKPTKMTATRANPTGTGSNLITQSYTQTFQVTLTQSSLGLAAE
jgi:hypothetical protein